MRIKTTPDLQKAKALKKMAEISLQRLNETDQEKYPTNTLNDYYDIIHKLIEAICATRGVKIKGEGAHQQAIDYIAEIKIINESERVFLQEMRELRNRLYYEGFMIKINFITTNKDKILALADKLFMA